MNIESATYWENTRRFADATTKLHQLHEEVSYCILQKIPEKRQLRKNGNEKETKLTRETETKQFKS